MASKIGGAKLAQKAESTRNMRIDFKEQIKDIIIKGNRDISSINKKIVLTGKNGTSKSSLSLSLLTHDLELPDKVPIKRPVYETKINKETGEEEFVVVGEEEVMGYPEEDLKTHEFVFYIDVDNSGREIAEAFFADYVKSRRVILWSPIITMTNSEGSTVVDRGATVSAIATAAAAIQDMIDEGYKVKGIIVDGISFVLEHCEAFMRDEKNLGPEEGADRRMWKIRNDKFREFKDPFMALPTTVIFIGHDDFIPELTPPDKTFASVKQRLIDECSMRIILECIRSTSDSRISHYVATIKKDRSNVLVVDKEYVFMTVNNEDKLVETNHDVVINAVFPNKSE